MKKITLLFSFLMSLGAFAQSTITITTSGGSWPTEKWVSITTEVDGAGSQIWGQGDGSYGNGQGLLTDEVVSLAPGTYWVNCYDRFADGWDGTLISIEAFGSVIGDNGGLSPDDGTDTDAGSAWDDPALELEASFEIIVPAPPSCPPPSVVTAAPTTLTDVSVSWIGDMSHDDYDYEWGVTGFTPGSGTTGTTSMTSIDISGLTSGSTYDIYVIANCGMDQSTTVGPITWTQHNLGDI